MSNIDSISIPRLSTYKKMFNCKTDAEAVNFYYWNQAVSAELYILLHNIEICLRNRIHEVMSLETSGQVDKNFAWYDHFDLTAGQANQSGQRPLSKTGLAISNIKADLQLKGKPIHPHNIICHLELGKWAYILKIKKLNTGQPINWIKCYPLIFRNYSNFSKTGRAALFIRLDEVRYLRNRIAHLEPVWKFGPKTVNNKTIAAPTNQADALARLNNEITWTMQVLNWICKDSHDHYKLTNSYRRLRILVSEPGLQYFAI